MNRTEPLLPRSVTFYIPAAIGVAFGLFLPPLSQESSVDILLRLLVAFSYFLFSWPFVMGIYHGYSFVRNFVSSQPLALPDAASMRKMSCAVPQSALMTFLLSRRSTSHIVSILRILFRDVQIVNIVIYCAFIVASSQDDRSKWSNYFGVMLAGSWLLLLLFCLAFLVLDRRAAYKALLILIVGFLIAAMPAL